jgi:hypothetical protein
MEDGQCLEQERTAKAEETGGQARSGPMGLQTEEGRQTGLVEVSSPCLQRAEYGTMNSGS